MFTLIRSLLIKYRSFVVYSFVGVINTTIDFLVFTIMIFFGVNALIAQAAAYSSGLTSSFFLNKYVTFKSKKKSIKQLILFLLVNGVTMATSIAAIYFFHILLGIQEHIAKIFFVTPIVMLLNYSGLKYIVFPKQKKTNNNDLENK